MITPTTTIIIHGKPHVVLHAEEVGKLGVELKQQRIEDGFLMMLQVEQFDHTWETVRQWVRKSEMSRTVVKRICDREALRQEQLREQRSAKLRKVSEPETKPVPPSVLRAMVREIHGPPGLTDAQWLARLTATVHESIADERLKQWVSDKNFAAIDAFRLAYADAKISESSRTGFIALFLIQNWQLIQTERMNVRQVHVLLVTSIGSNLAGSLEAFQKILRRLSVRLVEPGRPKK